MNTLNRFILSASIFMIVLTLATIVHAGNNHADAFSSKDIIMMLFGLLQTLFMGIGVWLISNDRELFQRLKDVENKVDVREAICEERWDSGHHPGRRITDK